MADEKKPYEEPKLVKKEIDNILDRLADDLDRARRFIHPDVRTQEGNPIEVMPYAQDDPEGTIYIQMSDTLAKMLSGTLRVAAGKIRELEDPTA